MWCSVCALTTVGYGDVVPITDMGRFLAALMSVLGVGLFALPAGILAAGFSDHIERTQSANECAHCGERVR